MVLRLPVDATGLDMTFSQFLTPLTISGTAVFESFGRLQPSFDGYDFPAVLTHFIKSLRSFWGHQEELYLSFVPVTFSSVFCPATTSPRTTTFVSFGVKPFFRTVSHASESFTVFPGLSITVAKPLFKLTSTFSTPENFWRAPRTA